RMRHLRRDGADVSGRLIHQRADGPDLLRRPYRGLLDAGKYVEDPRLPLLLEGHLAQPTIVVAARLENIAAEIERGQVQQAVLHEAQDVEDAPRASVAVRERMNRFELVVQHRHAHERIEAG